MISEQQTPTLTPASVAAAHFQKEVEYHQAVDLQSKTLVLIHDDCYGHRFSRPRTSKAALGTIVERPERVRAGVLGVSAAFVRLGRRHAGELFSPHPDLEPHRLPVPFQIRKTARAIPLSSPAVTNVHGIKWMDDLKVMCDAAESRLALGGRELVRPQSSGDGNEKDSSADAPAFHEGDLYLCSESLNAFQGALGGVCDGVDAVFGPSSISRTFVCIRPPGHHCSSDFPSGFCWINNVNVGISYAAMTYGLTHAAILDFDLHHGDGSQDIVWEQNRRAFAAHRNAASYKKAVIGYFSMHDINSYPCEMGDVDKVRNASVCVERAHGQSIWNIHLEPWKTTAQFWEHYHAKYSILIEKARAYLRFHTERLSNAPGSPRPKAAIFISAGFDASEWEGSGMQRHKVNVPTDFYAKFTADVVRMSEEEGLGVDGRVISVLEGGYSDRALTSGIFSHVSGLGNAVHSSAVRPPSQVHNQKSRLGSEIVGRPVGLHESGGTGPDDNNNNALEEREADFRPEWWEASQLDELDALAYPSETPQATTKHRERSGPTYSAPTRSSSAKTVAAPARDRRQPVGSRVNSETDLFFLPIPVPDVGWASAAHELSKILIPDDRPTMSYRSVDLNAEASRIRRERQVAVDEQHAEATGSGAGAAAAAAAAAATDEKKMQLRVRKTRASQPVTPKKTTVTRGQAASRRTSIDTKTPTTIDKHSRVDDAGLRESTNGHTGHGNSIEGAGTGAGRTPSSKSSSTTTSGKSTMTTRGGGTATPKASPKKTAATHRNIPRVPKFSEKGGQVEQAAAASSMPPTPAAGGGDVDSLSAGIHKLSIKLNVPTPEENEARQKEKEKKKEKQKEKEKEKEKEAISGQKKGRKPLASSVKEHTSRAGTKDTTTTTKKEEEPEQSRPSVSHADTSTETKSEMEEPFPNVSTSVSPTSVHQAPSKPEPEAEPKNEITEPLPNTSSASVPASAPVVAVPISSSTTDIDKTQTIPETENPPSSARPEPELGPGSGSVEEKESTTTITTNNNANTNKNNDTHPQNQETSHISDLATTTTTSSVPPPQLPPGSTTQAPTTTPTPTPTPTGADADAGHAQSQSQSHVFSPEVFSSHTKQGFTAFTSSSPIPFSKTR